MTIPIPSYFFAPKTASGSIPEDIKALCRKLSEAPLRAAEFLADAKRSWQSEIDDFHRRQAYGRAQLEEARETNRRLYERAHCIRLRSKDGLERLVDVGSDFHAPVYTCACRTSNFCLGFTETRRYQICGYDRGVRLYEEI